MKVSSLPPVVFRRKEMNTNVREQSAWFNIGSKRKIQRVGGGGKFRLRHLFWEGLFIFLVGGSELWVQKIPTIYLDACFSRLLVNLCTT